MGIAPFHSMVEHQYPFMPEVRDKNAKEEESGLKLFDPEEALKRLQAAPESSKLDSNGAVGVEEHPADRVDVHCIVKWGKTSLSGKQMIVVQVLRVTHDAARQRAAELSTGCPHG